jgi:ketosteroid isomerase-like protein
MASIYGHWLKVTRGAWVFMLVLASIAGSVLLGQDGPSISQAELVRREQAMMDAVVPGDQTLWKLYFADDALFFDEKGRAMDKQAMLEDLNPMPKGYSGTIKVTDSKVLFAPNVAILSYNSDETETIYGQELHARYHTTDTWLYRDGRWQIAASQVLRYYEDPAIGAIADKVLKDYAGTYEVTPGHVIVVTLAGKELFAQRDDARPVRLLPESPDMFFRAGAEGRRLFQRDGAGKVVMLIDRRNNEDVLWKKIR